MTEKEIIERHFLRETCPSTDLDTEPSTRRDADPDLPAEVVFGIGDDAAVLNIPSGQQLVVSMDTLIAGIHFTDDALPEDIGHKALAVNLSDLAAMGAIPRWLTLSLTLAEYTPSWVQRFADGLFSLADRHQMTLIGGDLTRGPLSITIQAHGLVAEGAAISRSGAQAGDDIYVSGYLGAAGHALQALQSGSRGDIPSDEWARLHRPQPRVELGRVLVGTASSMVDVSDGLGIDLGRLIECSEVGAELELPQLPLTRSLIALPAEEAWQLALCGGDDYELCFTAPVRYRGRLQRMVGDCPLTRMGRIVEGQGLSCLRADGSKYTLPAVHGYQHF